jgi:methionine aminopeptidase
MTDYKEKFEKMRVAGKLASQTLDMLTDNIKEGVSTDILINWVMNLSEIMEGTLLHSIIEGLQNLCAHL